MTESNDLRIGAVAAGDPAVNGQALFAFIGAQAATCAATVAGWLRHVEPA